MQPGKTTSSLLCHKQLSPGTQYNQIKKKSFPFKSTFTQWIVDNKYYDWDDDGDSGYNPNFTNFVIGINEFSGTYF